MDSTELHVIQVYHLYFGQKLTQSQLCILQIEYTLLGLYFNTMSLKVHFY